MDNGARPPLIGITTYGRDAENKFTLPAEYSDAVRRAGGIPVLLPPGEPHLDALLQRLDGLILAGGGDVDPELYDGARHDAIYMIDPERDTGELAMARQIATDGKPTLGICRGAQVINVALGGKLVEHLPDEVGETVTHRMVPSAPTVHGITIAPQSRLAAVLGTETVDSASWHHQAVRRTGVGLTATAWAPDGTIEATEAADHPWLVAVQWHPEITAGQDPVQQQLFQAFVDACREHAKFARPAV